MCAKMRQSLKLRAMGISTLSAATFTQMPKDINCLYQQQQCLLISFERESNYILQEVQHRYPYLSH